MRIRSLFLPVIIGCSLVVGASGPPSPHPEHIWDYSEAHGPSHWGDLKPELAACKSGHRQSPIDIRNPRQADLPPIQFDYKPSGLHIIDNGHTIMINYVAGSSISVGGKKYVLKQFHFHRPSEERIDGKSYEMTVHLVHQDQDGNLAVVAVLLQKGDDNSLVHELWNDLPKEKEKEEIMNGVQIDVGKLLPADRGYYTFPGSLTTPPCSENVTWFVLKHPMTVSSTEIEQFSKLYRDDARPTQPLYDRVVLETK
ncbi:MAG TPA: carbonic anhydrase family protein [Candidatus Sulfotelmatobacter sp.]|jgi:carbonic anhydrase|nr:carbonic anhydrase family protein [Candidatus Sulfotelmatobacter sp.]